MVKIIKNENYNFTDNDKLLETNLHDYIKPYFEKKNKYY